MVRPFAVDLHLIDFHTIWDDSILQLASSWLHFWHCNSVDFAHLCSSEAACTAWLIAIKCLLHCDNLSLNVCQMLMQDLLLAAILVKM